MSLELLGSEEIGETLPGVLTAPPSGAGAPPTTMSTSVVSQGDPGFDYGFYPVPAWPWPGYGDGLYEPFDVAPHDDVDAIAEAVAEKLKAGQHVGAMSQGAASWDEVRSPSKVTIMPHGAGSTILTSGVARVAVMGGNYWKPDPTFQANANNWDSSGGTSPSVTVYFANGTRQTWRGVDAVSVIGGALRRGVTAFSRRIMLGADYTDAFFAAKTAVDVVLAKADSKVNLVQHAAVQPFLDKEAAILEGFRRGVDGKDRALVDSATAAMTQLAALARQHFLNPTDGSVKSQTEEAATQALVNAGGDIEKFKADAASTMTWLKWGLVAAAVVAVLGVVGLWIVPLITRKL